MHPADVSALIGGAEVAALLAEGSGYAAALLQRIAHDASGPADLVAVIQFVHHPAALCLVLQAGPLLHGCAAPLFMLLRLVRAPGKAPTR